MRRCAIALLICPLFAAAAFAAAAVAAPASQPSAAAIAPAHWAALLQNLGSPDFARREAAQKELDQTTWRDLDLLKKSISSASDPEIKARLEARLAAINEDLAVNPPPISIDLKNATLSEVGDVLSKVLGTPLEVWPRSNRDENTFTLTATDKPFWEVFLALSAQRGLILQDLGDELRLYAQNEGWHRGTVVGPIAVFPENITRQRVSSLQKKPGAELGAETMSFYCNVIVDPRIRIVSAASPTFSEIIDDAGNILYQAPERPVRFDSFSSRIRAIQSVHANLAMPEKMGTRIASAKGDVHFIAQVAEETLDIADPENKSGREFVFADRTITLERFTVQNNGNSASIDFRVKTQSVDGIINRIQDALGAPEPPAPTISLINGTGKTIHTSVLRGGLGASIGGTSVTPPFKLRLSIPTKTKQFSIPFELKDLPLP